MKKTISFTVLLVLLIFAFLLMLNYKVTTLQVTDGNSQTICKVLEVDNSEVIQSGVSAIGYQRLKLEVIKGSFKNEHIMANNPLLGQYEYDQLYTVGDKLLTGIKIEQKKIVEARAVDYYRQNYVVVLFAIFAVILLLYAKKTGVKALFSFLVSLLIIWYILIPALLKDVSPILITTVVLVLLSGVIIFSVAGFGDKGISAFLGTIVGIIIPILLAVVFGELMKIFGLTAPYASNLMFKGYTHLDFKSIFYCSIMIGASGACMDISMDVAASMEEIKHKKPDISRKELVQSGISIGQAVIGTMTTTLLLAYSGGYLTLMMLFYEMETSLVRMLNMKIFSTEVMRILIGSIALVIVAPVTAVISGYILSSEHVVKIKIRMSKNIESIRTNIRLG